MEDRESWEFARYTSDEWDEYEESVCAEIEDEDLDSSNIEVIKAQDILSPDCTQTYCSDCEPICLMFRDSMPSCKCNLYSHFVKRWRCIPCVIKEQAKTVTQRQPYKVTYKPNYANHSGMRDRLYKHDMHCECGRPVDPHSTQTCRKCGGRIFYYAFKSAFALMRLHAQLGTSIDGRSEDPILSQLG